MTHPSTSTRTSVVFRAVRGEGCASQSQSHWFCGQWPPCAKSFDLQITHCPIHDGYRWEPNAVLGCSRPVMQRPGTLNPKELTQWKFGWNGPWDTSGWGFPLWCFRWASSFVYFFFSSLLTISSLFMALMFASVVIPAWSAWHTSLRRDLDTRLA